MCCLPSRFASQIHSTSIRHPSNNISILMQNQKNQIVIICLRSTQLHDMDIQELQKIPYFSWIPCIFFPWVSYCHLLKVEKMIKMENDLRKVCWQNKESLKMLKMLKLLELRTNCWNLQETNEVIPVLFSIMPFCMYPLYQATTQELQINLTKNCSWQGLICLAHSARIVRK